jgi:hypothetical protein
MPIIRKVVDVGNSKMVAIPKDWFEYYEKVEGVEIEEVAIEVNKVIKIWPIIPKNKDKQ